MKRFLWAVLAAFLLTGCEIKQDEQMIPSNSFWPGWDSPLEQTLADGISSFSEKIYLPAECKDQLDIAFWHILCAKPEFFFLNGEYRYSLSEDTLIFSPSYTMTKSEALTYAEKLETISDGLLNGVSDALSTEDRALLLHDRLLHKLSYDQKHASPLLDALLAGCADCEGYARAYQYLLQKAGIPALYVTGEANGGGHAWIIMECEDGTWYHVDPTWDDGENTVSRAYFMQNDSVFGRTHKIRPAVPGASYPSCTGDPHHFFAKRGIAITDAANMNEVVRRSFDEAASSETNTVEFCFPSGVSLDALSVLGPLVLTEAERRSTTVRTRITAKNSYIVSYQIAS